MTKRKNIQNPEVAAVFETYPKTGVTPITRTVLHSVYKQFGGLIRSFFLLFNTPFKVNRGLLLDTLVSAVRIIPSFNPGKDREAGLCHRFPGSAVYEFALKTSKETLRHRVVVSITHRPHGGLNPHFLTALTKRHTGVLTALVGMVNHRYRSTRYERHI